MKHRPSIHGGLALVHTACAAVCTACAAVPACAAPPLVGDPGQGTVAIATGSSGAAQLSGITRSTGGTYHAVGDAGPPAIWTLAIDVDGSTGRIRSAAVTGSVAAAVGADAEGIAFRPATDSLLVADEAGSTIREFSRAGGIASGTVPLPAVFAPANVRTNLGIESLAWGHGSLWTATEEALFSDGDRSTPQAGSWVRIQRFDNAARSSGQWAYRTQPASATPAVGPPAQSGVVDLLPWNATTLLVLEREFLGMPRGFHSRLYAVDVSATTDVSAVASLATAGFTPRAKTLLWERVFPRANFEGMTFGPPLAAGGTSLLLVADDAGGLLHQGIYPLIVRGTPQAAAAAGAAVPEPLPRRHPSRLRCGIRTTVSSPCRPACPPRRCPPR